VLKLGKIKIRIILLCSIFIVIIFGIIYFSKIQVYEDILIELHGNETQSLSYEIVGLTVFNKQESFVRVNDYWKHESSYFKKILIKSKKEISDSADIKLLVNNSNLRVENELSFFENNFYYYEINYLSTNGFWSKIKYVLKCNKSFLKLNNPVTILVAILCIIVMFLILNQNGFPKSRIKLGFLKSKFFNNRQYIKVFIPILWLFFSFLFYKIFSSSQEYLYLFKNIKNKYAWLLLVIPIVISVVLFLILRKKKFVDKSDKIDFMLLGLTITGMLFVSLIILWVCTDVPMNKSITTISFFIVFVLMLSASVVMVVFLNTFKTKHNLLLFMSSFFYFYLILEIVVFSLIKLNVLPYWRIQSNRPPKSSLNRPPIPVQTDHPIAV
jgi:hypothetical protein